MGSISCFTCGARNGKSALDGNWTFTSTGLKSTSTDVGTQTTILTRQ